jgi:hypothetical protein
MACHGHANRAGAHGTRPPGHELGQGRTRAQPGARPWARGRGAAEGARPGRPGRGAEHNRTWGGARRGGEGRGSPGRGGARRARPRGGAQGCGQGGRTEEEGEGEEREREKGRGNSPRGSKLRRSPFQDLGHHGEREMGGRGRGRLLRGRNQMRERDQGEGGAWVQGRQGRAGRTWPDRAGMGRARPHHRSKPTTRTTTNQNPIANQSPKRDETNTRLITTSDKEICLSMMQHP